MSQNDETTVQLHPGQSGEALDLLVYEWVRERVIDGTFKPGERIRERNLAEELQVSRIPIREAFPRLESEGYIKTLHRRGAVVAEMTVQDVRELFQVRSSLEVLAARLAADACAHGASGEQLLAALAEAERAVRGGDGADIAARTSELHDEILALSNSRLLQTLMVPIEGRIRRLFHFVTQRDEVALHREHEALCTAIVNGQTELAAALALAHVERSRYETMPIVEALLGS
ncbi:MAG TPA: GntR family transcriptional regulator [Microbacterium sp.]|uniref:GntR family transcriptional regulator n=1 Tax=Microbacterium sp. TaxID=51671 RepID=UPI002B45BF94|nr:GntR family transcriptional regulator [Microbacterium sp.]HKT55380.1 GntR family transcriptional regulator [Microbacterium sp.]